MSSLDRTIVLVGLMGSGKSRIGIELSRLLNVPFLDSDKEIERAAGFSVSEIFVKFGEDSFRKGEAKVIERLLKGEPKILASGGGAFVQDDLRATIKSEAISVWLKTDIETLIERTSRGNHRPLLHGQDRRQALEEMMEDRYPLYEQADLTVITDGLAPLAVAREIRTALLASGKLK